MIIEYRLYGIGDVVGNRWYMKVTMIEGYRG